MLGLRSDATELEVKGAFRRLAKVPMPRREQRKRFHGFSVDKCGPGRVGNANGDVDFEEDFLCSLAT